VELSEFEKRIEEILVEAAGSISLPGISITKSLQRSWWCLLPSWQSMHWPLVRSQRLVIDCTPHLLSFIIFVEHPSAQLTLTLV